MWFRERSLGHCPGSPWQLDRPQLELWEEVVLARGAVLSAPGDVRRLPSLNRALSLPFPVLAPTSRLHV